MQRHLSRVADTVPRITQGNVTTVAGTGEDGFDDGIATEASFSYPAGIALYYDDTEGASLFSAVPKQRCPIPRCDLR